MSACNGSPSSCAHKNTDCTVANDCNSASIGSLITTLSKLRATSYLAKMATSMRSAHRTSLPPPTKNTASLCYSHRCALFTTFFHFVLFSFFLFPFLNISIRESPIPVSMTRKKLQE